MLLTNKLMSKMEILLKNPITPELAELLKLRGIAKEKHNANFKGEVEVDGYVFCNGSLLAGENTLVSTSVFVPIASNVGYSRVICEVLCLATLLEMLGETISWLEPTALEPLKKVNLKVYKITEDSLRGASSLSECLKRIKDSEYPNYDHLLAHLETIRNTIVDGKKRRPTKNDVADYMFNQKADEKPIEIDRVKAIRSGQEWSRVKRIATLANSLPEGYSSATDFANFATNTEVDAIELQNHSNNE